MALLVSTRIQKIMISVQIYVGLLHKQIPISNQYLHIIHPHRNKEHISKQFHPKSPCLVLLAGTQICEIPGGAVAAFEQLPQQGFFIKFPFFPSNVNLSIIGSCHIDRGNEIWDEWNVDVNPIQRIPSCFYRNPVCFLSKYFSRKRVVLWRRKRGKMLKSIFSCKARYDLVNKHVWSFSQTNPLDE